MPNTLPTCPREDCTATIGDHWHDSLGYAAPCPHTPGAIHGRCYAQRPTPTPLAAILAAAEDAKRAHDRLCDLAETLLPESSPVKTADNPAPVVLPTVDEAAEAVVQSMRDGGWTYRTAAQAVLDLIADRVPVWVPVEPGTVINPGTRWRFESGEGATLRVEEETAATPYTCRPSSARYYIDPRTVPAEPEDPRVAAIAEVLEGEYGSSSEDAEYDPREYHQAAVNAILAKLDGLALNDKAGADQ